MSEASTSAALTEHRKPPMRNDSFSTVNSSMAAAEIMQQYSDLDRTLEQKPEVLSANPPKMKFENSDGIHVGDVVYHIHHHSPKSESGESRKNSSSSISEKMRRKTKFFSVVRNSLSGRKTWIALILLPMLSIAVGVSVSVYFFWGSNQNNGNTDANETTTEHDTTAAATTADITTTDITTTTLSNILLPENFVTRENWGADKPKSSNIPKLKSPISRIIIAHTRGIFCTNENDCISTVKSIQTEDSSLDDIPYNFLIGGDGRIYEGRGFSYQGQHTQNLDATEYNSIGICVAFIGNYTSVAPDSDLLDLLKTFIDTFVEQDVIANDHIIVLQDDLKYFEPKADALNEAIKLFKNFYTLYRIYRREEWIAQRRSNVPDNYVRIMDWVLIGHSVTPLCTDLNACKARARSMQQDAFRRNPPLDDIPYNIMFGGDGVVLEGVGWDYWGTHAIGFNSKTIGVGVIGDFTSNPPNQGIIDAMLQVFDDAMILGKLTDDYKIFGRSDFAGPGPGAAFMNKIREWCRYGNRTISC